MKKITKFLFCTNIGRYIDYTVLLLIGCVIYLFNEKIAENYLTILMFIGIAAIFAVFVWCIFAGIAYSKDLDKRSREAEKSLNR